MTMNIVSRKPRADYAKDAEVVLVKRDHPHHPFVVATITPESLKFGEWCNGHYFRDITDAAVFFANYPENRTQSRNQ